MRKAFHFHVTAASVVLAATSMPASAFLSNWYLNLDGGSTANAVQVAEYLDFVGNSFIQNTFTSATTFNFTDQGTFQVTNVNGGAAIGGKFPGWEMTAVFSNGAGTGSTATGQINFTSGVGTLSIYAQNLLGGGSPVAYGTGDGVAANTTIYGADDGTLIGTFVVSYGYGSIDPTTTIPNGQLTIAFEAQSLLAGIWFDSLMTDLSANPSVLGFVTTNATRLQSPQPSELTSEIVCQQNGFNCPTGTPFDSAPNYFLVSNNGQWRLDTVPEPGTLALLGLGLLGAGGVRKFSRRA